MTTHMSTPTIILVPGHWLGAWAWDEVCERLTELGQHSVAVTLPGLDPADPERRSQTLSDQVEAIGRIVVADANPVVIVAHSGANAPVTAVLDRHPELVHRVVWVDSGPVADGVAFAAEFPQDTDGLPLPPFDVLGEQASTAGLTDDMLSHFRAQAVDEPGGVLREAVLLTNDARYEVPTTFVCCSMPSAQVTALAESGHPMFAEVTMYTDAEYVDLETGHWPMWSRPIELAEIIVEASTRG